MWFLWNFWHSWRRTRIAKRKDWAALNFYLTKDTFRALRRAFAEIGIFIYITRNTWALVFSFHVVEQARKSSRETFSQIGVKRQISYRKRKIYDSLPFLSFISGPFQIFHFVTWEKRSPTSVKQRDDDKCTNIRSSYRCVRNHRPLFGRRTNSKSSADSATTATTHLDPDDTAERARSARQSATITPAGISSQFIFSPFNWFDDVQILNLLYSVDTLFLFSLSSIERGWACRCWSNVDKSRYNWEYIWCKNR